MRNVPRRPLTARSVLASTLLGADPPELPVAYLVHVASLFGVNENRARVALSRMAQAGEATSVGPGRYRLAGHLLERQQRQTASRLGTTRSWRGGWHVVVVTTAGSLPGVRSERRRAFERARLAELRDGTWIRPDNLELELPENVGQDVVSFIGPLGRLGRLGSSSLEPEPATLCRFATELFRLEEWSKAARVLLDELTASRPGGPEQLADGFVLSAAVLRHLQADPLLPVDLLPADWLGERLRRAYDGWDRSYRELLADWSRRWREGDGSPGPRALR